ncbi:hypothetical protein NCC49_004051 [Naganishia albida]|nr:hypothetical protein NCC49_004051 [Naganishia albida]
MSGRIRNPRTPLDLSAFSRPSHLSSQTTGNRLTGDATSPHEAGPSRESNKGKERAEGKTKVKEKKVHKCTFAGCEKTFITLAHVRRHLRTHTNTQPYPCEFCEKRFARSDVRNRHMQLSHKELYDSWLAGGGRARGDSKVVEGDDELGSEDEGHARDAGGAQEMDVDVDASRYEERRTPSTYREGMHDPSRQQQYSPVPSATLRYHHTGSSEQTRKEPLHFPQQHDLQRPEDPGPSRTYIPSSAIQHSNDIPRRIEEREGEGEMFSRLDILLAAAADDSGQVGRSSRTEAFAAGGESRQQGNAVRTEGGVAMSGIYDESQVVGGVGSTTDIQMMAGMNPTPGLAFPANNPNASLTPEAFIATTLSLNSASPLDAYGLDFDMGIYHDVFGWGLGAADVQRQQPGEVGWAYDMLDLSALNNPMEFVGQAGTTGLAGFVAGLGGMAGVQDAREEVMPSGRPSGRTTRQGTATPGNGEEETPWPHVFRPAAVPLERPLSLPYAIDIPADSSDSFLSAPQQPQISASHHASILRLVKLCHGASPWREPDYTHFPSTAVLSHCVGLYFIHFHPILPILRPKAYMDDQGVYQAKGGKPGQTRDEAYGTLLMLTVAAIGAAYAEDRMKPLGGYLMELARRTGSYLQLSDPRSIFSIPYIQSRLLVAVGGYADGSRERYLMSEVSKGLLVTASRRLQLLRHRPARSRLAKGRATESHPSARPPTAKEVRAEWREWRDEEERLRLGWAIFIFDSQAAAFLNVPAAFSLNEIQVRLPDTEDMWNMSNASMWDEANRSRRSLNAEGASPFGTILSSMTRQGRLQERVSEFGKWILAHSLYRLCDAANMQNILLGFTEPVHPPLSDSFSRPDQRNPFILLGQLVNSWQSDVSFARPSPFFASTNVLRHYSNIRFILPRFLDHVQQAAGKVSVSASKESSQRWLKEYPTEPVLRRIFVESIQLAVFLLHSRLDAPWEPVILLDCALSLWAVLRFRPEVLQLSASSPGSTIMRSGSRTTDYLERWIIEGGPLKIQGMSYNMTPDNVLTDFVTRLQDSPWGLSFLYAAVLNNLRPKEAQA